jgi:hypothetical protein
MVAGIDADGAVRMMSIHDLYDQVAEIRLDPTVPADIAEQFDKARHAYVYSWFAYDLASLAEQPGCQSPSAPGKAARWRTRKGRQRALGSKEAVRSCVRSRLACPARVYPWYYDAPI